MNALGILFSVLFIGFVVVTLKNWAKAIRVTWKYRSAGIFGVWKVMNESERNTVVRYYKLAGIYLLVFVIVVIVSFLAASQFPILLKRLF